MTAAKILLAILGGLLGLGVFALIGLGLLAALAERARDESGEP